MNKIVFIFLGILAVSVVVIFVKEVKIEKIKIVAPIIVQNPVHYLDELLKKQNLIIEDSPIASDSALLVRLSKDQIEVWFNSNKDLSLQVSSLQIVLDRLKIEGRVAKRIDLRFKDPIVVY